ncbi:Serine/threonine protein kinase [Chitinispirillum alkaliphilum]|nr:Serine/threonine protein kinase [Chitinispirillum alkaliphilum]
MKRLTLLLVLLGLFSLSWANQRHALLIGANNGGEGLDILRYAESDALRFANVLRGPGEFSKENVFTLLSPDSAEVFVALQEITNHIEQGNGNSLFLFYYSGHSDGEYLLLGDQRYSLREIKTFLDSSKADIRIAVIDACYSGAVIAFRGGRRGEPFFMSSQEKVRGQVIISSSAAHQRAQESDALGGGIFTHHWINGLRGSADMDGDRYVTLNEAYRYAYLKTIESSALTGGGIQHPSYHFNIQGEGEIRLTNLNRTNLSGVLFDQSCEGAFLVLSPTFTNVYADFTKQGGVQNFISLAPGEYSAINARGSDVFIRNFTVGESETVLLTNAMLRSRPLVDVTRVRGPDKAEGPLSTPQETEGLFLHRWGLGTGAASGSGVRGGADMVITGSGSYRLEEDRRIFYDLHLLPFSKSAGFNMGVNVYKPVYDFHLYAGGGPGVWYLDSHSRSVTLAMRGHFGFSRELNQTLEIQGQIPLTILFSRGRELKSGIEIRFLFTGKSF